MPQHIWHRAWPTGRVCDICDIAQRLNAKREWVPHVSAICPGSGRKPKDKPVSPLSPKVLEPA